MLDETFKILDTTNLQESEKQRITTDLFLLLNYDLQIPLSIIAAVKDDDWNEMLKHFPEGVEHRTYKYTSEIDFLDWDSYEDYERYVSPARDAMKEKCLEKAMQMFDSLLYRKRFCSEDM